MWKYMFDANTSTKNPFSKHGEDESQIGESDLTSTPLVAEN
jgi:hypothetical protein